MRIRLINKMIITYLFAITASFLLISFFSSHVSYKQELKLEADKMYREASYIANNYGSNYYSDISSPEVIKKELRALSIYFDCGIMLISTDGDVIIDTNNTGIAAIEDFDPTDYGKKNYSVGRFYNTFSQNHLTVFYPVVNSFKTRGYIVLNRPTEIIRSSADSHFNYNYITMLICFSLSALIFIFFYRYITKPIKRMTDVVGKYARGDFSEKINIKHSDEIGKLSESLDYMATEINNLNEYQKKFIADISHDFRSPLTSIKGYLEAMLDGTIPPEAQEKYLEIVISETERLTKLTNNLLTINNVTDRGMILDISAFDIIAIIKQTIETFQGTCEKRKIKFKLIFSDKELYIVADQSKIQQVIYNLIDNAIKFSNSDSSIIISVSEKGDKALISVKDFGIGIPKESIPKIWERFYKTDLSRGKDKKGTGLGLSIVKEIIAAHNEYIDVVSTEGVGTEFTFALPKAKESREPFLGLD